MYNVNLSDLANMKIRYWVDKCDKEISGFGTTIYDATKKEFTVLDVFLIEQTVGMAHTDIDPAGLGKLMYKTRAMEGSLNFWWHSHVNMDVFWSGTDKATIMSLGGNGWIVASVFNKKEEVRSACAYVATSALNENKPETVFYDNLDTFILRPDMEKTLKDDLDDQFKTLVKETFYSPNYSSNGYKPNTPPSYQNWSGYDERDNWDDYSVRAEHIAKGNIHDATKSGMTDPYNSEGYFTTYKGDLTEFELDQLVEVGAFGFGFAQEAKILGLTHKAYRRILKKNNMRQLQNLEDRVLKAEGSGDVKSVVRQLHTGEGNGNYSG